MHALTKSISKLGIQLCDQRIYFQDIISVTATLRNPFSSNGSKLNLNAILLPQSQYEASKIQYHKTITSHNMTHSHKKIHIHNFFRGFSSDTIVHTSFGRIEKKPLSTISVKCVKRKSSFFIRKFQRQTFIPKYCAKQTLKIPGIAIYLEQFQMRIYVFVLSI